MLPSPLKSPIPIKVQAPEFDDMATVEDTTPLFKYQTWFSVPLLTSTSVWPSLLKSAVPLIVQPAGGVNATLAISVTTSPGLSTT